MVKVNSTAPRVMTHDKEAEEKKLEELGDDYKPYGFFDTRNPAVAYNVIVFTVESIVMQLVWIVAYLIPTFTGF